MAKSFVEKMIEEELKAGKEIRDILPEIDKEIARVKREIQKRLNGVRQSKN